MKKEKVQVKHWSSQTWKVKGWEEEEAHAKKKRSPE